MLIFWNATLGYGQEFTRFFLDSSEIQTANSLIREPSGSLWLGGTQIRTQEDNLTAWLYRLSAEGAVTKKIRFPVSGIQSWAGMKQLDNKQIAIVIGQNTPVGIIENWLALVDTTGLLSFRKLEGLDNAVLDDVTRTRSGKILTCGFRPGPNPQGNNFFMAKVNPVTAQTDWLYEESLTYTEHISNAIETRDGSIVFCGDIMNSTYNPYVAKLDSNGNFIWDLIVATPWNDGSQTITEDSLGRIWLVGESSTSAGSLFDNELNIISSTGQLLWQQWIGSPGQDAAFLIKNAKGPGLWVGGYSNAGSNGTGPISPYLMRLDPNGNSLGEKFWPMNAPSPVYDMDIFNDSIFHFCGISNNRAYLMRFESPELQNVFTLPIREKIKGQKCQWWYNKDQNALVSSLEVDASIEIRDLSGKTLIRKNGKANSIPLHEIPDGIYFLFESDKQGNQTRFLFRKFE